MIAAFREFFRKHNIDTKDQQFLVAASGGLDSTVLIHLCAKAELRFAIAHVNFGLRGAESERDEAFVRSLAEKYGVAIYVDRASTKEFSADNKMGIQEAARILRYRFFETLCRENGFDHTLLAHHADDQVETVLMHFFRGTGLKGLTGMPERSSLQAPVLRPLLHFRRTELEAFALAEGMEWVEDSSNNSNAYTRNFFRNELIPSIQEHYPGAAQNILATIERLQSVENFYDQSMEAIKKKLLEPYQQGVRLPWRKLREYAGTPVIFEIIKDYGFGEKVVSEVEKLLSSGSGKYIANADWQIIKHRNWLLIVPRTEALGTLVVDKYETLVRWNGQTIEISSYSAKNWTADGSNLVAQFDADKVSFPLLLRPWKTGDYFYPLGMRKKKKINRFLIDARVPKDQKEKTWVIESDQRIIWVGTMRIDDRVKVLPTTRRILELRIIF